MNTRTTRHLPLAPVLLVLVAVPLRMASAKQEAQPPAAPPAEPAPAAETPAEPMPTEGAAPSTEDRLTDLESFREGLSETLPAMQSDIAGLKKLKFSGYVQGRYEWHDDANFGVNPASANAPRETNRFFVRRGRIKATYAGDLSEFVFQIDATGDGVALRDAEASFVLTNENPWFPSATPWELKLSIGQLKYTFGYEILQSSSDREMPERTAVVRALFPGERDRGLRLTYSWGPLRFMSALVNGNGTSDAIYRTLDQTSWKDVLGRVGADLEFVVFGVSGYLGRNLKTTLRPAMGMTPASAAYERYGRTRFGADAQFYFDVPVLGGFALKGELIWAKDDQMEFSLVAPDMNGCKDVTSFGWYVTAVQNFGPYLGLAVRYDQYDPNTGVNDACADMLKMTVGQDRVSGIGVALLGYVSGNLKATVAFEHLGEQGMSKDNDQVTVQLQAKF